MSNGEGEVAVKGNKISDIAKKLAYLDDACKKNLNLSSEIRAKLLASESKEAREAEKTPREGGQLNNIRDQLQDLLNYLNVSNAHLISVKKEL